MARKTIENGDERIEVLNPAAAVPDGSIPEASGAVRGSALEKNPEPREEATPPKRYRVLGDKMFMDRHGYRAKMREGKEIDSHNYDIAALRRQGIKLEEIPDEG